MLPNHWVKIGYEHVKVVDMPSNSKAITHLTDGALTALLYDDSKEDDHTSAGTVILHLTGSNVMNNQRVCPEHS